MFSVHASYHGTHPLRAAKNNKQTTFRDSYDNLNTDDGTSDKGFRKQFAIHFQVTKIKMLAEVFFNQERILEF